MMSNGHALLSLCTFLSVFQEGNNPQGSNQGVKITPDQPKKPSFFRCTLLWVGERGLWSFTIHGLKHVPHWTELDGACSDLFFHFTFYSSFSCLQFHFFHFCRPFVVLLVLWSHNTLPSKLPLKFYASFLSIEKIRRLSERVLPSMPICTTIVASVTVCTIFTWPHSCFFFFTRILSKFISEKHWWHLAGNEQSPYCP